MNKMEKLLLTYLEETNELTNLELSLLTEETKISAVKELAKTVLKSVEDKSKSVETQFINKSKGDILRVKELEVLVNAFANLEHMVGRASTRITPELKGYIEEIKTAVKNLRTNSNDFKQAYRERNVVMILKYQSIVLSIFSSFSYLMSVMVDFSGEIPEVIAKPTYELIAPLKAVIDFNKSVNFGDYKKTVQSVMEMQQYLDTDNSVLLEENDIIDTIVTGIKGFYKNLDNQAPLTDFLYKAAGVVTLIVSLRDVFYTFYRSRTKWSEMIESISKFANISTLMDFSGLSKFSSMFKVDVEEATKMAQREIQSEDKNIGRFVKSTVGAVRPAPAEELETPDFADFDF